MSRSPICNQQWHSATKRHILNGWNDNIDGNVDGCNADHVKLLQTSLETKFQQIVENFKSDAEAAKIQQEDALSAGLVKLTKATREMTVREFNQKHQCDLLALLNSKDGVRLSNQSASRKREHHMVEATPAPRTKHVTAPMSISRTIRKGEGLYSANGSPVDTHEAGTMVATVTKKRRGNEGANFEINVGDGRVINLNDPTGVHALDSDMKATAASQLKVLQDQMASLMAQLTK